MSIKTELNKVTENKAVIKDLQAANKVLLANAYKHITQLVNDKRESDKVYKEAKKATLIKLIKAELDSKESVINTACNVMLLGLNLDNTLPLATINYITKLVSNKRISKAKVNKADKEALLKIVAAERVKDKTVTAEKLLGIKED